MINLAKHMITALSSVRLAPLIVLMFLSPNRGMIWADMDQFVARVDLTAWGGAPLQARNSFQRVLQFVAFMTWITEFRNVFYFRTGKPGILLSILCRPMVSLHIESKMKVGPGFFVMHGDGTFVNAQRIGENCRIWQQVTIGIEGTDSPTIGNNVTIYAGAKVVGKVSVGDNVTIAANSLVIKDVPSNVTVIGVPAVVVWKKQGSNE